MKKILGIFITVSVLFASCGQTDDKSKYSAYMTEPTSEAVSEIYMIKDVSPINVSNITDGLLDPTPDTAFVNALVKASYERDPSLVVKRFGADSMSVIIEDRGGAYVFTSTRERAAKLVKEIFTNSYILYSEFYMSKDQTRDREDVYIAQYIVSDPNNNKIPMRVLFAVRSGVLNRVHFY